MDLRFYYLHGDLPESTYTLHKARRMFLIMRLHYRWWLLWQNRKQHSRGLYQFEHEWGNSLRIKPFDMLSVFNCLIHSNEQRPPPKSVLGTIPALVGRFKVLHESFGECNRLPSSDIFHSIASCRHLNGHFRKLKYIWVHAVFGYVPN